MTKKSMYIGLLLGGCIAITNSSHSAIRKRKIPVSYRVSVAIPCHHAHAKHLERVCTDFAEQSCLPDEIVISLSGVTQVDQKYIDAVTETEWPFRVRFVFSDDPKSEAQNRNISCTAASGDIIICHDADDLSHPSRVEIIKYFFEKYPIVHLMHGTIGSGDRFPEYESLDRIEYQRFSTLDALWRSGIVVANGPIALKREVLQRVLWDESCGAGVDVRFNERIYECFAKTLVLKAQLYRYHWAIDSTYYQNIALEPDKA